MTETIQNLLHTDPSVFLDYDRALPIFVYLALALAVSIFPLVKACLSIWNTLLLNIFSDLAAGRKIRGLRNKKMLEARAEGSAFKDAFSRYVGHTGALLAAIGLFYLVSKQQYELILLVLIALLALSMLFWIRTFIGFFWAIASIMFLAAPLYYGHGIIIMHVAIFLSSVILVQSVLRAFGELKSSVSDRKMNRGKGFFGRFKWIPAMIFSLVLLSQSLYAGFYIVTAFLS
ncbi:M50 family metallopeptidase [Niallia taxi]|uniref:M50 family metallopeptidase n=1 Tax=Niallia taxi TaxID=2499688 RepID=UPI001244842C|nr:M50 family metallopeptidase [Niallia taxi]MDK8640700.1 M50 family metallopeptidase [Niallia taxi]MED4056517.1 M50 family metallopeptidase [Niallia taxi]MED4118643.1 M50 family metallopeptidase [Niallia taxi]